MFIFMLALNVLASLVSFAVFATNISSSLNHDLALIYFGVMIVCIFNAVMFGKLNTMQKDIQELKEHCGLNNENTNNTTPPSEE